MPATVYLLLLCNIVCIVVTFSFPIQLTYKVPQADLVSRTLYLCVWDHGSLPKHCLGAVTIEVASLNELTTGIEDWYVLGKVTS